MVYLMLGIALLFAVNIGGSGTAAAVGGVYGSGAASKRLAMVLAALAAFTGAAFWSHEVSRTIGGSIIPVQIVSPLLVIIVLASATVTLATANLIGIPLSTSEVTVGALIGVGAAFGQLLTGNVLRIVVIWIWVPVLALALTYIAGRILFAAPVQAWLDQHSGPRTRTSLKMVLIAGGCYQALAAGMNNVGNAVGPVAAVADLNLGLLSVAGGAALAAGALLLGGRVLETNGRQLVQFDLAGGLVIAFTGGTLVVGASLLGYPVPLTQVTTMGIIGVGLARGGLQAVNGATVQRVVRTWVLSPFLAAALSYALVALLLRGDLQPGPGLLLIIAAGLTAFLILFVTAQCLRLVRRRLGQGRDGLEDAG